MELWQECFDSAVGPILLVTSEDRLYSLDFQGYQDRMLRLLRKRHGSVQLSARRSPSRALKALRSYFAGMLEAFQSVPLRVDGTDFQNQVWRELMHIKPGTTSSYGAIAEKMGKPGASRAVGMANRSNPIALAIPCHRVIAANGSLGGFAGGVEKKEWLLNHERKWA